MRGAVLGAALLIAPERSGLLAECEFQDRRLQPLGHSSVGVILAGCDVGRSPSLQSGSHDVRISRSYSVTSKSVSSKRNGMGRPRRAGKRSDTNSSTCHGLMVPPAMRIHWPTGNRRPLAINASLGSVVFR